MKSLKSFYLAFEKQKYKNTTEIREEIKSTKIVILQYVCMYVANHYVIHLKLIQGCMSILAQ